MPSPSSHVVLLGDSVLDNGVYVPGEPDVAAQVAAELGASGRATLLAVDGDVVAGVARQLRGCPSDATHLVVSVGGNDALGSVHLLGAPVRTVADALAVLAAPRAALADAYAAMLDLVLARGLPTAVCTIYDTRITEPPPAVVGAALSLFNDVLTRAAVARGVTVLDLRLVCTEDADYANPIEPSSQGGAKIARAVRRWVHGEEAQARVVV